MSDAEQAKAPADQAKIDQDRQLIVDAVKREFGSFVCKDCGQELIGDQKYERCPDSPDHTMHRDRERADG